MAPKWTKTRLKTFQSIRTPRTEFWLNLGCMLAEFWLHFDWISTEFRLNFDCNWLNFDWSLAAFWLHFSCIWLNFDCILTAYWLKFGCILTANWILTEAIYIYVFGVLKNCFVAVEKPIDKVSVELILVKLTHKKRKESNSPYVQAPLGTTEIPVNPSEDHPPSKAPALSISSESFNLANGHHIKTCSLMVRIHHSPSTCNGNSKHNGNRIFRPNRNFLRRKENQYFEMNLIRKLKFS